jgi:hypothetical protein
MQKIEAEGFTYDAETRDWTKRVTYEARTLEEAQNWVRFNRDWMKGLRIVDPREQRGEASLIHSIVRR